MSSHHIVRDDQEPALIIANGESCHPELLGQLLEWSPKVIVLDRAMDRVVELGIKADVLLGDFDRGFDPENYIEFQHPLEIVVAPDQNKTDLEKAFDYLIERGHRAANVIWATGRRTDHTFHNLTILAAYRDKLNVVILDDYSRVMLLPRRYEKWYPKGTTLSLMPMGTVTGITTQNLLYPLEDGSLKLGYRTGSSNRVAKDGVVSIIHESGDLLLMECQD